MKITWLFFIAFITFTGCGGSDSETDKRSYKLGTVPMPQNLDFTTSGMNSAFDLTAQMGKIASLSEKISWSSNTNDYGTDVNRADTRNLEVFISVDVLTNDRISIDFSGGAYTGWTAADNFSTTALRSAFINEVEKIATDHNPRYIMLGIETNVYKTEDAADFAQFVTLYNEAYDAIKVISSDIKVGTTFQYEHIVSEGQWAIFDDFKNKIDVLCFTSYPGTLAALTDTYYTSVIDYFQTNVPEIADKKIVFTEIGLSGSDQADFIDRFFSVTETLNKEGVMWCLLHDWPGGGFFEFMGLIDSSGTKRESWARWNFYFNKEYSDNAGAY